MRKIATNTKECNEHLKKIGKENILCLNYCGCSSKKSLFKCLIHNYEWETTLDLIKQKVHGCPKCGKVARIKSISEVNTWIQEHNINIECIYYDGTTNSSKSKFRCCVDDYEWTTAFNNIKQGRRCPKCSGHAKIDDINEVNKWLKDNNKDFICITYSGNVINKSLFECKICGHTWESTFNNIKNGNCCPSCSASKGEKKCKDYFDKHNITYIPQYEFEDLKGCGNKNLKFDFAIFKREKLLFLLEYDGIFHYEKQYDTDGYERLKIHDERKNIYCRENNIPLLRIPYWDFDNIENILNKYLKEVT